MDAGGVGMTNLGTLSQAVTTTFVSTNSTANSNLTVNLGTKAVWYLTNNISVTNFSTVQAGHSGDAVVFIRPQGVNRTVVWPAFQTPTLGAYFHTNTAGGGQMFTTLTNGQTYTLSVTPFGTNLTMSLIGWGQ
jgi:hypothetical protein